MSTEKYYECDDCCSPVPDEFLVQVKDERICKICHKTHLGNIVRYRSHYPEAAQLALGICQVANLLMSEIRKIQRVD